MTPVVSGVSAIDAIFRLPSFFDSNFELIFPVPPCAREIDRAIECFLNRFLVVFASECFEHLIIFINVDCCHCLSFLIMNIF